MDDGVSLVDLKHIFFKQKEIRPSFIFLDCWRGIYSFKTSISLPSERESWLVYLERSGRPPPSPPLHVHIYLCHDIHTGLTKCPHFILRVSPCLFFVFCFLLYTDRFITFAQYFFFFFFRRAIRCWLRLFVFFSAPVGVYWPHFFFFVIRIRVSCLFWWGYLLLGPLKKRELTFWMTLFSF